MPATITLTHDTAVKALSDKGCIGGYLVLWGSPAQKDLQGEYFTPETDLALKWYPRRPVLYHHGLDEAIKAEMIGALDVMTPDDTGLWVEAQLDMHDRWAQRVLELVERGVMGWSSGSLMHLVEVARDGKIIRWPVVEGSLTPTPAEPRQPNVSAKHYIADVTAVKHAYKSAGLPTLDLLMPDSAIESETAREQTGKADSDATPSNANIRFPMEGNTMPDNINNATVAVDPAALQQMIAAGVATALTDRDAAEQQTALEAKAERAGILEQENEKLKTDLEAAQQEQRQPARRLPGHVGDNDDPGQGDPAAKTQVIFVGSPFDHLDAVDMAFGHSVMKNAKHRDGSPISISDQFANALASKAWNEGYRPQKSDGGYYKSDEMAAAIKADELPHTTQTGFGLEWVPTLWQNELWRKARQDNVVLPLFRSIQMPSATFELPIQGADPSVYYVPETTDETDLTLSGSGNPIPDSKVASGKVTLTAKKLALRIGFPVELVEDSIVPILPLYREQAMRAMADAIDNVLLNGDTETGATGNVNSDDGAPAGTAKYLPFNGLRKLGLVTNTANAYDAGGSPTLALMRKLRSLMPGRYGLRRRDLAWLVEDSAYYKLMGMDELLTVDKYGPNATVLSGEIGKIDSIPVLPSAEYGLTEADGKISTTPSNNTKGQLTLVYRPGWVVGYRRQISAFTEFLSYYDAYMMTITMRLAFVNFDNEVASTLYNITV